MTIGTGYTFRVVDGKTTDFKKFALECAHAWVYDSQLDDPLPDEKADDKEKSYFETMLEEAETTIDRISGMSDDEKAKAARADYQKAYDDRKQIMDENVSANARVEAMIKKVHAWAPPGDEYLKIKGFMLEQLGQSHQLTADDFSRIVEKSGTDWYVDTMAKAKREVLEYTNRGNEDKERRIQTKEFFKKFRESL